MAAAVAVDAALAGCVHANVELNQPTKNNNNQPSDVNV